MGSSPVLRDWHLILVNVFYVAVDWSRFSNARLEF
jgi:hypothetical protein